MRALFLALLLLAGAVAPAAAQSCWLGLGCDGEVLGPPNWQRGGQGWHAWFFWRPPGGAVRVRYVMCSHAEGGCMGKAALIGDLAQTCKAEPDPLACAAAQWAQRVAWKCDAASVVQDAAREALCKEGFALFKADAAARGIAWPSDSWVVSRSGMSATATTRPVYPFAAGVRGGTAVPKVRATIGAACDCSVRSVEGVSNYCAHDAARVSVTLCQPAK